MYPTDFLSASSSVDGFYEPDYSCPVTSASMDKEENTTMPLPNLPSFDFTAADYVQPAQKTAQ